MPAEFSRFRSFATKRRTKQLVLTVLFRLPNKPYRSRFGRVGATDFQTSLIPKDGRFLVPLKVLVRRAENLDVGDEVTVHLTLDTD